MAVLYFEDPVLGTVFECGPIVDEFEIIAFAHATTRNPSISRSRAAAAQRPTR
jgi:hypothetical protein